MTGLHAALAALLDDVPNMPSCGLSDQGHEGCYVHDLVVRLRALLDEHPAAPSEGTAYVVPDGPKMLRETLCVAQSRIGSSPLDKARKLEHIQRLGRLIDECDRHRPLGPDGKHDDRHTPSCGCEDAPADLPVATDSAMAEVDRCPKCRHAPHTKIFCPNMASDNDCSCTYATPDPSDRAGLSETNPVRCCDDHDACDLPGEMVCCDRCPEIAMCPCGHGWHLHDPESVPAICLSCGHAEKCPNVERILADRLAVAEQARDGATGDLADEYGDLAVRCARQRDEQRTRAEAAEQEAATLRASRTRQEER